MNREEIKRLPVGGVIAVAASRSGFDRGRAVRARLLEKGAPGQKARRGYYHGTVPFSGVRVEFLDGQPHWFGVSGPTAVLENAQVVGPWAEFAAERAEKDAQEIAAREARRVREEALLAIVAALCDRGVRAQRRGYTVWFADPVEAERQLRELLS